MKKDIFSSKNIGQILNDDFLTPLHLSQSDLARAIKVPRARISDIISGKRAITTDTDLRLCRYFSLKDGYFLRIQEKREVNRCKNELNKELRSINPYKGLFDSSDTSSFVDGAVNDRLHIALICGGPSRERGISLNSARSIMDHLTRDEIELYPLYVDYHKNFYEISKAQLYSNTPSDFDFKLTASSIKLSKEELLVRLKGIDIVFPVVHGAFGEDGELQEFLEKNEIPFVGSTAQTCKKMFHKYEAAQILSEYGYETLPSELLRANDPKNDDLVRAFFKKHRLNRAIVKPAAGGSSIGVFSVFNAEEAIQKSHQLFAMEIDEEAIIEPFCYGKEFTVIVLQGFNGRPVALIPSEIEVSYEKGKIFDYRRKYLPTANTKWPCPPHFDDKTVLMIQKQAEDIFDKFGMRDFARLDGWVMNDGRLLFTDLNPISGMEQNSFIFQQSSRVGFTHRNILWQLVCKACHQAGVNIPAKRSKKERRKQNVHVLFGGKTAERQVSLMSGTNVWLKLLQSDKYSPTPFFLDTKGHVWHLPYTYALNHTVEEIYDNCLTANATIVRLEKLIKKIHRRLDYAPVGYEARENLPRTYSFDQFLKLSKEKEAFIFLGLHGGDGEDGTIQQFLTESRLPYNGSDPEASLLCMDKYLTGEAVLKIGDSNIITAPKKQIRIPQFEYFEDLDYAGFWRKLQQDLNSDTFIIKPKNDGCSAGIVHLYTKDDLKKYIRFLLDKVSYIEENTFRNQPSVIEMAQDFFAEYIIEAFIETDYIRIVKNELIYRVKTGWIECTVGVIEKNGFYHAFNPSITIAEGEVLSLEEKFQGGSGVNITPPPENIITRKQLKKIKNSIETVAKALRIENYARLDIFFNVKTDKVLLIEANTLPGLTGSTVIYHQALTEESPMYPKSFLERLIDFKIDD